MGGPKRKGIKQMEKQQSLRTVKRPEGQKQTSQKTLTLQKISRVANVEPKVLAQIEKELKGMKYVTPSSIALKYNIKVGVAKDILKSLEDSGLVKYASGNERIKIYVPTLAA